MQTNYDDMEPAIAGMLGESDFHDIESRTAGEAIPFGRGLVVTADGIVTLPDSASDVFAGIAVHKQKAITNGETTTQYADDEEVLVLRRGRIWVVAEEAVNPTDEVWLRTGDTYQGHLPGNFRTDDDGSSEPICKRITNAKWVNVTTEAGLALLEINLP